LANGHGRGTRWDHLWESWCWRKWMMV
jgi:hypothetical protein